MTRTTGAQRCQDSYAAASLQGVVAAGPLIEEAEGVLHFDERRVVEHRMRHPRVPHIVGIRSDQPGSGVTAGLVNYDTIRGGS